jgi:hypothetical protein
MPMVERDQRGPVAALSAVMLVAFLQISVSIWYAVEVGAGGRHACTGHVCNKPVPQGFAIARFTLWGLLFASLCTTAFFGAQWVLGTRSWRRLAIAAGVSAALLIATVVLAVVYPPWSRAT